MRPVYGENWDSSVAQATEAVDGVFQRYVRWTRVVKDVACNYHEVGFQLDCFADEFLKSSIEVVTSGF